MELTPFLFDSQLTRKRPMGYDIKKPAELFRRSLGTFVVRINFPFQFGELDLKVTWWYPELKTSKAL